MVKSKCRDQVQMFQGGKRVHSLRITGHCYSLKNGRQIQGRRKDRESKGKFILAKRPALRQYMEKAALELRTQFTDKPLDGPVAVRLRIYYKGPTPDELGPAETIFDILELANVVRNDRQLHLYGDPAIRRRHVSELPEGEQTPRVDILVWEFNG